ncbi:MAG: hypothetical protein RM338_21395 [Nostoc sp. DedQUE12a]|nr:hypothetical protein [Nostoc sp. DedQUE12a]
MSGDKKRSSLRTSSDRFKKGDVYHGLRLRIPNNHTLVRAIALRYCPIFYL